jgi:tRNA A37 threonylcarbamoyladenosine synthetase subunit TsaC/SUA5/YrdC
MNPFDIRNDARRAMDAVLAGGIAIIPTTVGYVILGGTTDAINRIIAVKQRGETKLNAMIGCAELHAALHVLPGKDREAVRTITQDCDLPMGTVAPAAMDHPMMAGLDDAVRDRTSLNGTIAMLLNAGPLLDTMAKMSFEAGVPVIGSSANMSLQGTKFRATDIEPEVLAAADVVIDYGLQRWARYAKSSTMINVHDWTIVRVGSCYDLISDALKRHHGIELPPEN